MDKEFSDKPTPQSAGDHVLVTGAAGLCGRSLVERLLREGQQVRAMVRSGSKRNHQFDPAVEIIEADVRDPGAVNAAMAGIDAVYHLAALTTPSKTIAAMMDINVNGTSVVARACLDNNIRRLVYTSSASVYGRRKVNRNIGEDTPVHPDSPYSISKVKAEAVLRDLHEKEGLPVVINRTSNVFGPGASEWRDMFAVIASGNFRFVGKGEGLRDLTDVDDFAEGLFLCATVPGIEGRVYNLVGKQPLSLYDWVMQICRATGSSVKTPAIPGWPAHLYNRLNDMVFAVSGREVPLSDRLNLFLGDRTHDNTRARQELGYDPKATAEQVVRETVEGYRERGWLPAGESK